MVNIETNYWSHGPVEIVDLPSYNMVDLSSSLCKRLPEASFLPKYKEFTKDMDVELDRTRSKFDVVASMRIYYNNLYPPVMSK